MWFLTALFKITQLVCIFIVVLALFKIMLFGQAVFIAGFEVYFEFILISVVMVYTAKDLIYHARRG